VTFSISKRPRLRLDAASYKKLHRRILERDGWRCQCCGARNSLQVHHIQSRGLLKLASWDAVCRALGYGSTQGHRDRHNHGSR